LDREDDRVAFLGENVDSTDYDDGDGDYKRCMSATYAME
jgi:hypothetical protein